MRSGTERNNLTLFWGLTLSVSTICLWTANGESKCHCDVLLKIIRYTLSGFFGFILIHAGRYNATMFCRQWFNIVAILCYYYLVTAVLLV